MLARMGERDNILIELGQVLIERLDKIDKSINQLIESKKQ
jgi:hypothetical protein